MPPSESPATDPSPSPSLTTAYLPRGGDGGDGGGDGSAPRPGTIPGDGGAIAEPPAGDLPTDDGATVESLTGGVESIITGVARQIGSTVKPAAAAAVAVTFGFPLALMIAVVLFLLGQSRLDGRDPKLRAAPLTAAETLLVFRDEDSL